MVEYEVSEKQGDRVTLHLRGRMRGDRTVEDFKRSLEIHYIDDGVKEIRVDLFGLEEISLEGIAVLLALWKESTARGKRFVGQGSRGQVREKLRITGTLGPLESPNP
jgi:anti-anti-sigma regulatory factor